MFLAAFQQRCPEHKMGRDDIFKNETKKTEYTTFKRKKTDPNLIPYIKTKLKWLRYLNVTPQIMIGRNSMKLFEAMILLLLLLGEGWVGRAQK